MPRFNEQSLSLTPAPNEKWREAVRETWRQTLLYIWEQPTDLPAPRPARAKSASSLERLIPAYSQN
ncbi:hypothetical protein HK16_16975 [Acetobacter senegalensis]|uniref:Uncharacterized protein n=2 Tax=Acetobacter TaxID=434 RepID=A0A252EG38_9PROT|nr:MULTISPECIES: hypothetical protein [Acetobacter]ATJ89709.1 hypothetical protein CIW82_02350 [Acetobacter tropicalis]OUL65451.1 hypothetical protein HK16_16975 [Acetobacter senegalensis]